MKLVKESDVWKLEESKNKYEKQKNEIKNNLRDLTKKYEKFEKDIKNNMLNIYGMMKEIEEMQGQGKSPSSDIRQWHKTVDDTQEKLKTLLKNSLWAVL